MVLFCFPLCCLVRGIKVVLESLVAVSPFCVRALVFSFSLLLPDLPSCRSSPLVSARTCVRSRLSSVATRWITPDSPFAHTTPSSLSFLLPSRYPRSRSQSVVLHLEIQTPPSALAVASIHIPLSIQIYHARPPGTPVTVLSSVSCVCVCPSSPFLLSSVLWLVSTCARRRRLPLAWAPTDRSRFPRYLEHP